MRDGFCGGRRCLPRRSCCSGEDPRSPWLLPDGRHILYTVRSTSQIRVVALDGTGDTLVTESTSSGMVVNNRLLFLDLWWQGVDHENAARLIADVEPSCRQWCATSGDRPAPTRGRRTESRP